MSVTSYDVRKVVSHTATATTPQIITPVGYSVGDEDVQVYGITASGTSVLIPDTYWDLDADRNEMTLRFHGDYAQVLVLITPVPKQPLAYTRDSSFLPSMLEKQLDRLTLGYAWLRDRMANVLGFDETGATPPSGNLGDKTTRALKVIGFDANGDLALFPTFETPNLVPDIPAGSVVPSVGAILIANGTEWNSTTSLTDTQQQLGLEPGVDIQAYSAILAALASLSTTEKDRLAALFGLTPTLDTILLGDGTNWVQFTEAAFKAQYDLEIGVDLQAFDANLDAVDQGLATTDSPTFAGSAASGKAVIHNGTLTAANVNKPLTVAADGQAKADTTVTHKIVAAGIHDWAGGAATTDSISVPGLLATDIIQCSLVARPATETLVLSAYNATGPVIDLTLSANGTDVTTKIAYTVIRAL